MTEASKAATLAEHLNSLPEPDARTALRRCCGAEGWVQAMAARRPFVTDQEVFDAAEAEWWALDTAGWHEAFAAHARIGDRRETDRSGGWSSTEQAGMASSEDDVKRALDLGNREYEARFDHLFLICATGKSGEEMLRELQRRLDNDPGVELRTAAEEQAKITRLRLLKLLEDQPETPRGKEVR